MQTVADTPGVWKVIQYIEPEKTPYHHRKILALAFAGGASLISAALMTLMVNARHLFYGISMLQRYKNTGAAKPYLIFALTDETYSIVCSGDVPEGVDQNRYYLFASLFDQVYWVAGSVAGTLLGSVIPFDTTGIDFSMTALFLVVMVE